MNMLAKKAKKGFTIVELVIVIAVIAILAAVLIPTFTSVINNANESAAMQESKNEWTNYLTEIAANGDYAKDGTTYYVVYNDGEYVFEVANGEFNTEPLEADETSGEYGYEDTDEYIEIKYTYSYTSSSSSATIYAPLTATDGKTEAVAQAAVTGASSTDGTYYVKLTVDTSSISYYAVAVAFNGSVASVTSIETSNSTAYGSSTLEVTITTK